MFSNKLAELTTQDIYLDELSIKQTRAIVSSVNSAVEELREPAVSNKYGCSQQTSLDGYATGY